MKIARPTLGEATVDVMRENVKRENLTHHALRITASASRANLAHKHPSILTINVWYNS